MNSATAVGLALTVLGLGGVFATGAATAAIPALFGLAMLGLGALMSRPARARSAGLAAAGVAALGILAPLGNLGRVIAASGFTLNAATFSNLAMALICALFFVLRIVEGRGDGRNQPAP